MAIAKVADRGSVSNVSGGTTTLVDLAAGGLIAVGNYLIARVAVDNTGASGAATTMTVSDPRSNTWTNLGPANQDPGGASAGMTCFLAYTKVTNAFSDGDDVTFTWGNATTHEAIVIEEWSGIDAAAAVAVAAVTSAGATASPSTSITPTAAGQLVYGALATEGPSTQTFTADADTTGGSWQSLTRIGSNTGSTSDNATIAGQYKIVTGTSAQTWNPTITAADRAAVLVVFAAAPAGTVLGGVVETESAAAVARSKTRLLALAVETAKIGRAHV